MTPGQRSGCSSYRSLSRTWRSAGPDSPLECCGASPELGSGVPWVTVGGYRILAGRAQRCIGSGSCGNRAGLLATRQAWAIAAPTTALLCKFWPVLLFPFLLHSPDGMRWRLPGRGIRGSIFLVLVVSMPYWEGLLRGGVVWDGLFGRGRNNDSVFALVLHLAGGEFGPVALAIKALLVLSVVGLRMSRLASVPACLAPICVLLVLPPTAFLGT